MSEYSAEVAKRKFLAIRRAQRRLYNRLNDLDWEYEVLKPELKELDAAITEGNIPQYELTDGS